MTNRSQIKRQGRASLKRHYLLFVGVCLIAAFLSSEFRGALGFSNAQVYASPASEEAATAESADAKTQLRAATFADLLQTILEEDIQKGQQLTDYTYIYWSRYWAAREGCWRIWSTRSPPAPFW